MSDASIFISNRQYSITENRIRDIFWYIGECYNLLLLNTKIPYSISEVKKSTTIPFEDFLRFRLVEDYLINHKEILKQRTSTLDEINFTAETQKEFIDIEDSKQKVDKIDIFINRLGLSDTWGEPEEKIYFAIECKRIRGLHDTIQYIADIEKFTKRAYIDTRLPFEGQLGFIENRSISHEEVVNTINSKLRNNKTIITDLLLENCMLNQNIESTYISKHKRNIQHQASFSVYHLFLDYSSIVVD